MTITFESGEGSLEVEPDSIGRDHAAFLADLVSPNAVEHPSLETVTAAADVNHEIIEDIVAHLGSTATIHSQAA